MPDRMRAANCALSTTGSKPSADQKRIRTRKGLGVCAAVDGQARTRDVGRLGTGHKRHHRRDIANTAVAIECGVRRLGAVLRKTIFDIYAAMPSSWNTPRMAARSAS
jgi:hypothetical protein